MPPDGTRRSGRIPKQIAITLIGSDMEGRMFSERTKTVLLSRHGAGIISTYTLSAEQELVIRSEESKKEIEARVVGQIGSDGDTHIYGVAFLDAEINFWGIDFPELSETEKRASQTLLECCNCHVRETADHSDLASDVMAVNQSIMRYCRRCGSSTLWKHAAPGSSASADKADGPAAAGSWRAADLPARADSPASAVRPRGAEPQPHAFGGAACMQEETAPAAATPEPVAPRSSSADMTTAETAAITGAAVKGQENRRQHARMRVNFKACVRRAGSADDVVVCEDMSRGGLRFKSRRQYLEKMLVEVSVPYSPGDQAIFVPAQIVYVQEVPEQKVYRYGVMYLRGGR